MIWYIFGKDIICDRNKRSWNDKKIFLKKFIRQCCKTGNKLSHIPLTVKEPGPLLGLVLFKFLSITWNRIPLKITQNKREIYWEAVAKKKRKYGWVSCKLELESGVVLGIETRTSSLPLMVTSSLISTFRVCSELISVLPSFLRSHIWMWPNTAWLLTLGPITL